MRNTALVIPAILVTSLVLSQLAGMQASTGPKEASPAGPIEIIGPWFGSERDAFLPVLDAFEAKTGMTTSYLPMRFGDLLQILDTQFAAGQTPADVIILGGIIRRHSQEGHVVHVNHLITEADFLPGALDPVKAGNTIYGVAYTDQAVRPGFWYKKSTFDANRWNQNPSTFAEFVALLDTIVASGQARPIVTAQNLWPLSDLTEHFIATYGGAQMHRDLAAGTLAWTDPSVVDVFNTYIGPLIRYFDNPVEWTVGVRDVINDKNALYFQGSWLPTMFPGLHDPSDWRVMALPGGVANQGIVSGAWYPFIPAYTDVLGEAKLFFQFLASAEGQAVQVRQGGHVATALGVPLEDYPAGWERGVAALMAGKEVLPDLDDTVGGDWQTGIFWPELGVLYAGQASVSQVLAAIQSGAPPPSTNTPPAASFTVSPSAGDVTTNFALSASLSSDAEDPSSALEARWDWEDDGVWDTFWSKTKTAEHRYPGPDTYTVRLEVRDTEGLTDGTTRQVVVTGPAPSEAQVGVKAGDFIRYDHTASEELPGLSVITGTRVEFLSLEGTDASVRLTTQMSDGTEQSTTVTVNIVTGEETGGIGVAGVVIPADLTTGDSVSVRGFGSATIEGETTRVYAEASRTVIDASFSGFGTNATYYWDKQTGVMVEGSVALGPLIVTVKAVETNMWAPDTPSFLQVPALFLQVWFWAIVAGAIIAVVGAVYFLRRRRPPQ